MKHILFVDDEPRVLEGLRRMLRPLRHEWQMAFASGGVEALEILAVMPCDVLVTDMRMPGMDGVQLLETVRTRFPSMLRIILTGQCNRDTLLRGVSLAHRHLTKPCDPDTLKDTVARACALQQLLKSSSLQTLASRLDSVPSLPSLYLQVVKELEAREPSLPTIGRIISQDMGMTAKILQLANSALFSLPRRVTSAAQAVVLLGSETTRALVLAAHVFSRLDPALLQSFALESLWQHSMAVSALARRVAQTEQADETATGYAATAGMLHDIGKVMLASQWPKVYQEVLARTQQENVPLWEAERAVFGAGHAEVGAYLLGLWGLPDPIIEAVVWHHQPEACPGEHFTPLTAVHAANALAHEAEASEKNEALWNEVYLRRPGREQRRDLWRTLRLPCGEE
jgi:putative nucleotidyltransferase with HDIG domain